MTEERLRELADGEQQTLEALTAAYNAGKMPYLYYSPAYDATVARLAALDFARAAMEAEHDK